MSAVGKWAQLEMPGLEPVIARPKQRSVGIIGMGPAAAFAYRAAVDAGFAVTIYQYGEPHKTPPGAFWLHWLPEDITKMFSPQPILIHGFGSEQEYLKLQWGDLAKGITSSFPNKVVTEMGYDPAVVLPNLIPARANIMLLSKPLNDVDVLMLSRLHEFIFQSFPSEASKNVQPALLSFVAAATFGTERDGNWVMYNGTGSGIEVREAVLFGNHYWEFPKGMSEALVRSQIEIPGAHWVTLKDLHPRTEPWMGTGNIHYIGRMAEWNRKRLSHEVYSIVSGLLK
jgi:hypothetical protein